MIGEATVKSARVYSEPHTSWLAPRQLKRLTVFFLVLIFYGVSLQLAQVSPHKLLTGLPKMAGWLVKAWPPSTKELDVLLLRAAETVAMAAIGTTLATILALLVCIFAARNLTPSRALFYPTRWLLNTLRGVDSFVFALLFVAAVGLGPFAG